MFYDVLDTLSEFQSFFLFTFFLLLAILFIGRILLTRFSIGSPLVGWYGMFLKQKRLQPIAITVMFLRMCYVISFQWMVLNLSLVNLLVYLIFSIVIYICVFKLVYIIYDLCYCVGILGLVYVLYLLTLELNKVQVKLGMRALYVISVIILVGVAICQFAMELNQLISRKEEKTKNDTKVIKYSLLLLPIVMVSCILPIYVIQNIDYIQTDTTVYQMMKGEKTVYGKGSKISYADYNCIIEENNKSTVLEKSPLYFQNQNKVLFTTEYSIIRPKLELIHKVRSLCILTWQEKSCQIQNGDDLIEVENFFLFDGKDTYYFAEGVTLEWNNKKLYLPSFCEVVVKYNQNIAVYDYANDTYTEYETGNTFCIATMDGNERINLSTDILYRQNGQEQMLFLQPALLNDLE